MLVGRGILNSTCGLFWDLCTDSTSACIIKMCKIKHAVWRKKGIEFQFLHLNPRAPSLPSLFTECGLFRRLRSSDNDVESKLTIFSMFLAVGITDLRISLCCSRISFWFWNEKWVKAETSTCLYFTSWKTITMKVPVISTLISKINYELLVKVMILEIPNFPLLVLLFS